MSERLVPVVEPRVRKRIAYVVFGAALAITGLVRMLVGFDPWSLAGVALVAIAVGVSGMTLWERWASQELVTKAERTRRYVAAFSRWEGVLLYAGVYTLCFALFQDDENYRSADRIAIILAISAVFGLFAGFAMDTATRWSQPEHD